MLGRVDHHERAAGHLVQDLGDPVGPTLADVGQRDAAHLGGLDPAAALLGDELLQIRRPVPEGGVLGELRRPGGDRAAFDFRPMDVAGGEPARLEIRRYQQDPVVRAAHHALPDGVEGIDLGEYMPAEGRIASADDLDRPTQVQREQVVGDGRGELDRRGLRQAAGVRQNETRIADVGQPGGVLGRLEHGHHRHVVHGLRTRRVVVQDRDAPAGGHVHGPDPLPRRWFTAHRRCGGQHVLDRCARTGGCHDSATSVIVMPWPSVWQRDLTDDRRGAATVTGISGCRGAGAGILQAPNAEDVGAFGFGQAAPDPVGFAGSQGPGRALVDDGAASGRSVWPG